MLPDRKRNRLKDYDYASGGAYFVTICTHERRSVLSRVTVGEGLAPPAAALTPVGRIVEEQILSLADRYPAVAIDKYVVMPNHIHLIVSIREDAGGARPSPTLFDVVRVLKSLSTRMARPYLGKDPLFQRSYYEHVIRNERDYLEIWSYIDENPAKWAEDELFEEITGDS